VKHIFNPETPFTISEPLSDQCVSPSAINEFDQCPAKYLWNRIFKLGKEEVYQPAEDGLKVHGWAEKYFIRSPRIEELEEYILKREAGIVSHYQRNIVFLEREYLKKQECYQMEVLAVEQKISSWLNRRVGYVDRIDMRPDGNLTVVDYKPHGTKIYPSTTRQLTFYALQVNFLIKNGLLFERFPDARVTHYRIIGYKDRVDVEKKLNKRSITALEKRIKAIRTQMEFPCKPGQPLCPYCKFVDNVCLQSNMDVW
jgi:RecB family exonuclease